MPRKEAQRQVLARFDFWLLSDFRKHWHLSHVALKGHPGYTARTLRETAPCVKGTVFIGLTKVAPGFPGNLAARRSDLPGAFEKSEFSAENGVFSSWPPVFTEF